VAFGLAVGEGVAVALGAGVSCLVSASDVAASAGETGVAVLGLMETGLSVGVGAGDAAAGATLSALGVLSGCRVSALADGCGATLGLFAVACAAGGLRETASSSLE
jgi:hypothetical protein